MKSKATEEDFWKGLATALLKSKERRPVGDGWRDIPWLAKTWGMVRCNTSRRAYKLHKLGQLERFNGYITVNGHVQPSVWYRPTKKK